jgi:hypothetical protein
MWNVDWRGLAVVLIVIGVFAVLLVGAIASALNHDRSVSADEVATVATVLGGAIGAVAVYLGTKANGNGKNGHPPDDPKGAYSGGTADGGVPGSDDESPGEKA